MIGVLCFHGYDDGTRRSFEGVVGLWKSCEETAGCCGIGSSFYALPWPQRRKLAHTPTSPITDTHHQAACIPSLCQPALLPPKPQTPAPPLPSPPLPITLRHPLQLILLLNRIAIAAPLGRVDQLLGQALGHALHVAERRLARADRQQRDGLVDAAQRGDVDGLAAHGAGAADAGAVFARAAVDDGVDGDLEGVGVGHDVDLWGGGRGLAMRGAG